ncbi:MAG: hypothetical protein AAFN79_01950 [Pseudomonadota bacterium]
MSPTKWLIRAASLNLMSALAIAFIAPGVFGMFLFVPPLLFIVPPLALSMALDALRLFSFLWVPLVAGSAAFALALAIALTAPINWHLAVGGALVFAVFAFSAVGYVYVADLKASEARRLGASCFTARSFFEDLRSLRSLYPAPSQAHGSAVIGGETRLWSYRLMTYDAVYSNGALKGCRGERRLPSS